MVNGALRVESFDEDDFSIDKNVNGENLEINHNENNKD
jgi:hypothetical protein